MQHLDCDDAFPEDTSERGRRVGLWRWCPHVGCSQNCRVRGPAGRAQGQVLIRSRSSSHQVSASQFATVQYTLPAKMNRVSSASGRTAHSTDVRCHEARSRYRRQVSRGSVTVQTSGVTRLGHGTDVRCHEPQPQVSRGSAAGVTSLSRHPTDQHNRLYLSDSRISLLLHPAHLTSP
jgi:hypothetical protein